MTLCAAITSRLGKDEPHWPVGAKETTYRNVCLLADKFPTVQFDRDSSMAVTRPGLVLERLGSFDCDRDAGIAKHFGASRQS